MNSGGCARRLLTILSNVSAHVAVFLVAVIVWGVRYFERTQNQWRAQLDVEIDRESKAALLRDPDSLRRWNELDGGGKKFGPGGGGPDLNPISGLTPEGPVPDGFILTQVDLVRNSATFCKLDFNLYHSAPNETPMFKDLVSFSPFPSHNSPPRSQNSYQRTQSCV